MFNLLNMYSLRICAGLFTLCVVTFAAHPAFAGDGANLIATNIIASTASLPNLISGLAYLLGVFLGIMGIVKLKAHVENPSQTPLGQAGVRLAAGGALFALPIVIEAALRTFAPETMAITTDLQSELDGLAAIDGLGLDLPSLTDATGENVNSVLDNIVSSTSLLPGLISALSYLIGVLLIVTGILKIKEYVDQGQSPALRAGIIRMLIAGTMFALPAIYQAMALTISGGETDLDVESTGFVDLISGFVTLISGIPIFDAVLQDFNVILANIVAATDLLPSFVAAVAYLSGLLLGVIGLLKIKDHVENPDQTPLKEGVIRLLVGGALFALPTIYNAMFDSVTGGQEIAWTSALSLLGLATSSVAPDGYQTCLDAAADSLGASLCTTIVRSASFPAFLGSFSYLIGLVLGLWGIYKIRDHVLNPQQTAIWEGISRLLAGGLFFALPMMVEIVRNTIMSPALYLSDFTGSGYNTGAGGLSCEASDTNPLGLDGIFGCFMQDVMGPMHLLLNFFAFVAGMILIMVGISRLIKSAQDGARGPGGIGTIMTFIIGGALMSYNQMMSAASSTLMNDSDPATFAELSYTAGMTGAEVDAAHIVITSIIQFMIVVGLISFVRGLFIVRAVAEGNQQASIMAGMTHIIGGALAVNLGPLINAVQVSLGIEGFGIAFS